VAKSRQKEVEEASGGSGLDSEPERPVSRSTRTKQRHVEASSNARSVFWLCWVLLILGDPDLDPKFKARNAKML
jgi:hypothetical protein